MNILVIAAHPDDEVLGVGGTIAHHVFQGDKVSVCVITSPTEPEWSREYIDKKQEEQKKVDAHLGISARYQLGFPTAQLNTVAHGKINASLYEVVTKVKPDVVYTHSGTDIHMDHKCVYAASLVATRPPACIKLICYETLSETEWDPEPFIPNLWIDISQTIEKKVEALAWYETEIRTYPHPRSKEAVKIQAQHRGIQVGKIYCEAFSVVRDIR